MKNKLFKYYWFRKLYFTIFSSKRFETTFDFETEGIDTGILTDNLTGEITYYVNGKLVDTKYKY